MTTEFVNAPELEAISYVRSARIRDLWIVVQSRESFVTEKKGGCPLENMDSREAVGSMDESSGKHREGSPGRHDGSSLREIEFSINLP